jgi:hypothetical protein
MKITLILMFFSLLVHQALGAQRTTFDETLAGKSCEETAHNQMIHCDYKVGNDLHVSIDGVGLRDVGITFMKSDFNGDFYGTVGMMHGCVIVKRGKASMNLDNAVEFAFISPVNGKVYPSRELCKDGR